MSHSPAHAPVWNRDSRRNSAPCFSKIAFPCLAALTISSGLSLLKRANCTIAITSSSLGYRKLPHETSCSCGRITAPLKHGGNAATNRGPERPDGPTAWLQGKTTLARKAANGWKRQFNDPIPLHQITGHPWRTSPPLRPGLSFRYTQARRRRIFRKWRQSSNAIAVLSTNALKQSSWYRTPVTHPVMSAGLRSSLAWKALTLPRSSWSTVQTESPYEPAPKAFGGRAAH